MFRKITYFGLLTLLLCGCASSPEAQLKQEPVLLCEKDGVRLYKVRDVTPGGWSFVYFTTPGGEVRWDETHSDGKTTTTVHKDTPSGVRPRRPEKE